MSTLGTRGKYAEKEVSRVLGRLAEDSKFVFWRLPDARAGSFQPTLADFLAIHAGTPALIEVKEVAHDFRLSYNNFSTGQVGKQRLWKLAGAQSFVLIYHSTTNRWRGVDIDYFTDRSVGGSWDLRAYQESTLEDTIVCQLNQNSLNQIPALTIGRTSKR